MSSLFQSSPLLEMAQESIRYSVILTGLIRLLGCDTKIDFTAAHIALRNIVRAANYRLGYSLTKDNYAYKCLEDLTFQSMRSYIQTEDSAIESMANMLCQLSSDEDICKCLSMLLNVKL